MLYEHSLLHHTTLGFTSCCMGLLTPRTLCALLLTQHSCSCFNSSFLCRMITFLMLCQKPPSVFPSSVCCWLLYSSSRTGKVQVHMAIHKTIYCNAVSIYRRVLFTHVHYFVHLNLCIALFFAFGLFLFVDLAIGKRVSLAQN